MPELAASGPQAWLGRGCTASPVGMVGEYHSFGGSRQGRSYRPGDGGEGQDHAPLRVLL
jgi:hypothetical protein